MHVILFLVGAFIALVLLLGLLYALFKGARYLGKGLLTLAAGIPHLAGRATHWCSRILGISWIADPLLALLGLAVASVAAAAGNLVLAGAAGISGGLALLSAVVRWRAAASTRQLAWQELLVTHRTHHDRVPHVVLWTVMGAGTLALAGSWEASASPWLYLLAVAYWAGAIWMQGFAIVRWHQLSALAHALETQVSHRHALALDALVNQIARAYPTLAEEAPALVREHVAFATLDGRLVEVELGGRRLLFCAAGYQRRSMAMGCAFLQGVRYPEVALAPLLSTHLHMKHEDGLDLLIHHLRLGEMHQFAEGSAFVPYISRGHVQCCVGCGLARWHERTAANDEAAAWYCSKLCEQTDRACLDIHKQEPTSFVNDAVTRGFTLMGGTDAWIANHKMFAAGGQGHGFAAEQANTFLDRLFGRSAKVVGGNNAKHGADRLVDGVQIQTKYCSTGARSAGEAFDNKGTGEYLYYNQPDNTPMQLEVPADQYPQAVEVMEQKIRDGKVPGVSDPAMAKELVVKGGVTYEQARNIVRFGRLEGLAFDIADGAVVSLGAASVSFCTSAALIYLRNGDGKAAVQAAALQAGKVGATTLVSYVAIQQLHRSATVQSLLKTINVGGFPPTLQDFLARGMGVKHHALNRALGGVAISSVVAIGMATAPDVYRMMRREITTAQLQRTLATATAGTAGAFVGSVIGGALGAPVGPLGLFIGRASGGVLGGMTASMTMDWLFAEQREREQAQANQRFRAHLSYLAMTFALTEAEVQATVANFMKLSNKHTQQRILSGDHDGRAYLNSLLKPLVVGVVKQRDYLRISVVQQDLQAEYAASGSVSASVAEAA